MYGRTQRRRATNPIRTHFFMIFVYNPPPLRNVLHHPFITLIYALAKNFLQFPAYVLYGWPLIAFLTIYHKLILCSPFKYVMNIDWYCNLLRFFFPLIVLLSFLQLFPTYCFLSLYLCVIKYTTGIHKAYW